MGTKLYAPLRSERRHRPHRRPGAASLPRGADLLPVAALWLLAGVVWLTFLAILTVRLT